MKKTLNNLFTSSLALGVISPSILITSCAPFVVDEEIKTHDVEGWKHAIEYIGSCKHPTLFINLDASFYIQQMMNLYFASAQYARQNGYTYTKPGYEYNDQILISDGATWNYKENKPGEKTGYFAYDYSTVVDSAYGNTDIIANSKSSQKIDLSKGNQMLITNFQDFDLTLDMYDKTRADYKQYYGWDYDSYVKIINKILDLYDEVNPNIKFNFVVCDNSFDKFFDRKAPDGTVFTEDSPFNKTILRMLRHMDKIYICSDGSYSYNGGPGFSAQIYYEYFCRNGYTSATDQKQIINMIQTLSFDEAINFYKFVNPYIFYNNEKYMVHFSPSINTCYSSAILNPNKHLTMDTTRKYSAPWFITSKYKDVLTDASSYNCFEKSILKFYNSLSDSGEIKSFENFIVSETRGNFDPLKKNLIFILPGAFRSSKNPPEILWEECQKITNKIKQYYPIDKWNYIYKLHPGTNAEDAVKILKKLLGDPIPNNCVVLEKTYPFEFMVSLDQTLVKEGIETNYHLINPNTFDDEKPSGILTGFDLLSSCFYTSISIFANEYGYEWSKVKKLIQYDAYYLTRKFDCYDYECINNKDYSYKNRNFLNNFYKLLNDVDEFVQVDKFNFIE